MPSRDRGAEEQISRGGRDCADTRDDHVVLDSMPWQDPARNILNGQRLGGICRRRVVNGGDQPMKVSRFQYML
jgi:hypothetical protein